MPSESVLKLKVNETKIKYMVLRQIVIIKGHTVAFKAEDGIYNIERVEEYGYRGKMLTYVNI